MSYTVKSGDCLWNIAASELGNALRWTEIADLNGISHSYPLIHPGDVLTMPGDGGQSSSSQAGGYSGPNKATIQFLGPLAGTDDLYATWSWDRDNTKSYNVRWYYNARGSDVSFIGENGTADPGEDFGWLKYDTYSPPENATKVWLHVQPVAYTYRSNDEDVPHWTADWSDAKYFDMVNQPPEAPGAPDVKLDKYKLTASLSNLEQYDPNENPLGVKYVQFQIVKDDKTVFNTGKAEAITSAASYSCTVDPGAKYKVRCRAMRDDNIYGDWSDYSSNVATMPATPAGITTIKATSSTSIYLEWSSVPSATGYELEYATKKDHFDGSDQTTVISNIEFNHYEKFGLETGHEYFFRVRAVNDGGESPWSDIVSVMLGKDPAAPTTWSSTTTAIVGEPLNLYWVHNAKDNSSETYAELEITVDDQEPIVHTIKKSTDEDKKDLTSVYSVDTSVFTEGTVLKWRVRTAGVTLAYGEWSVQRTVDIYAPVTLELRVTDIHENSVDYLGSFPFYIYALPGPRTQVPIAYHVTITSNEVYETVDQLGNPTVVNKNEDVYSRYFDISEELLVELSAGNVDLENNISYTVTVTVTMNSGLTKEATHEFQVQWNEVSYLPNASISINSDALTATIRPFCEEFKVRYCKVLFDLQTNTYTLTDELIPEIEGMSVEGVFIDDQPVFSAIVDQEIVYFCVLPPINGTLVEGVTLSVYRREFDGSFTELATGLSNTSNTYITDPHPALDFARYRIVAMTESTGAISYYDPPGYPVNEHSVIIQWDEAWRSFETSNEDAMIEPAWSGSVLKLPYNIDVADKNNRDVQLVEYIGRKHPVSYYGTQLGASSTWNMEIEQTDKETIYALRRLAIYSGDVYVREPSGTGYWANISVSFSQKHCELTIPVTLELVRVEGGA